MGDSAAPVTMRLYAIAPTQFSPDARRVDAVAIAENLERVRAAGIDRVLLMGAYGEFPALTDAERLEVLRTVVERAPDVEVMACAASISTEATAALAVAMREAGAHRVMVSPPLACETTDRDVVRHFTTLSTAVGGDLVVYNNSVFGHDLEPRLLGEVLALDGYVAIKQGTRDVGRLLGGIDAIRSAAPAVEILLASDISAATTLAAPVDGLTSTNCWVFPEAVVALVAAAGRGDLGTLRAIHDALRPYRQAMARLGQPAGVKAAMQIRGYAGSGAVRGPYAPVVPDQLPGLSEVLTDCDARLAAAVPAHQEAVR